MVAALGQVTMLHGGTFGSDSESNDEYIDVGKLDFDFKFDAGKNNFGNRIILTALALVRHGT
jgi:hypothetical protein